MNPKRTAAFLAISLAWGTMWIVRQQFPDPSTQLSLTAIILGLSAISLAIAAACFRPPLPSKRGWLASATLGITLIAVPYLLTDWASPHLPSGIPVVIAAVTPLLAGFFCDSPWPARNASIAGLGGVLLVVSSSVSTSWNQLPWMLVLLGGSCLVAASLAFAQRQLATCHPVYTAAIELAVASAILGPQGFARGKPMLSGQAWIPILFAVAGNALAAVLYFWLLQHIRIDQLTSTIWAQLLISVAEGIFLLRPHLDWRILLGAGIIVGSIFALHSSQSDEQVLTVGVT